MAELWTMGIWIIWSRLINYSMKQMSELLAWKNFYCAKWINWVWYLLLLSAGFRLIILYSVQVYFNNSLLPFRNIQLESRLQFSVERKPKPRCTCVFFFFQRFFLKFRAVLTSFMTTVLTSNYTSDQIKCVLRRTQPPS